MKKEKTYQKVQDPMSIKVQLRQKTIFTWEEELPITVEMTVGLTTILDPAGVQNQGLKVITRSRTEDYFQDIHQENILRVNLIEIIV